MTDNTQASEQVRVACVQMEPHIGENAANLARSLELCDEAVRGGAQLLVLPELCNSGYVFETRSEARAAAEEIPTGPASAAWIDFCRDRGVYLVAGVGTVAAGRWARK